MSKKKTRKGLSFKKKEPKEDHRKTILQFKGVKDPYEPLSFPFFPAECKSKYKIIRVLKTFIRKASLWICCNLEKISILDRTILKDDLSNFHKISNELYRGGQPLGKGFYRLKKAGIKTVVNLRAVDTDHHHAESAGLLYYHISFRPHMPRDIDVIRFLKIMHDKKNHPVYLHCYHGSDRTGMMCAIYRLFFQNWHKDKAIYEMIHGGFGFHLFFQHNLINYLKKLDIEAMKAKAGIF